MANIVITSAGNARRIVFNALANDYDQTRINKSQIKSVNIFKDSEKVRVEIDGIYLDLCRTETAGCMVVDDIDGTTTWANVGLFADSLDALM